jgi:hypothetical protein
VTPTELTAGMDQNWQFGREMSALKLGGKAGDALRDPAHHTTV